MFVKSSVLVNVSSLRYLSSSSSASPLLKAGDVLRHRRIFSDKDVVEYSKVTHDANPLHLDSGSARAAGFEDRLVHGMLVASLFPRIISSHFVSHFHLLNLSQNSVCSLMLSACVWNCLAWSYICFAKLALQVASLYWRWNCGWGTCCQYKRYQEQIPVSYIPLSFTFCWSKQDIVAFGF